MHPLLRGLQNDHPFDDHFFHARVWQVFQPDAVRQHAAVRPVQARLIGQAELYGSRAVHVVVAAAAVVPADVDEPALDRQTLLQVMSCNGALVLHGSDFCWPGLA